MDPIDIEQREMPFFMDVDTDASPRSLECLEALCRWPGNRLVARARLDGRQVAVKLFFGWKAGWRWRCDKNGVTAMSKAGVPSPALVAEGRFDGGYFLAFEWLNDSRQTDASHAGEVVELLARLHRSGVMQHDPRARNFLASGGRVFMIDGGRIKRRWMGHRASLSNLARFFRLFDENPASDERVEAGYRRYCQARGWTFERDDLERLHGFIDGMQRRYARKRQKRARRNRESG